MRNYYVRHQSENRETIISAKNHADAAELHGGIAVDAGINCGNHREVRMYDGTITFVREAK